MLHSRRAGRRPPPPGPLKLTLPDGTLLFTNETEVGVGQYPAPETLLELVAAVDDPSCSILRECARQVFSSGPIDKVSEWGNCLLSTAPGQGPDPSRLSSLHLTNKRGICGYSFKKGDICWNCRTCQVDPTCVQCDTCFKNSDHTGHEVFFHSSSPGGCCDCGDLEAWKQAGCCTAHSGADPTADPSENLPPSIRASAVVVFEEACKVISEAFMHSVQCFNGSVVHRFFQVPGSHKDTCFVRLHNDDIHTFEQVTKTLVLVGLTEAYAHQETKRVDEEGHAHVKSGPPPELRQAYETVTGRDLLVSLVDEAQLHREYRAEKLLSWLSELCHRVDGFARLVAQILTAPANIAHPTYEAGTKWNTPALSLAQQPGQDCLHITTVDASVSLRGAGKAQSISLLALLLVTDFFLLKKLRQEFHDLLLNLLTDSNFKPALAMELTTVYPVLNGLYTRGIGTAEDSIFSFTVQLYTTPSLVRWLAFRTEVEESEGSKGLLTILTDSLLTSFHIAGWVEPEPGEQPCLPAHFWDHHFILHRRFQHVLKDLDYTLQTAGTAWAMREGTYPGPGPKPLSNWINLLGSLQLADLVTRKTGAHLEYESTVWMHAFSLALPLASTCSVIIQQGLKPDDEDTAVPVETLTAAVSSFALVVAGAMLDWTGSIGEAQFRYQASDDLEVPLVRFEVKSQPVSYHLPLHRFLVSIVLEGLAQGATTFPVMADNQDLFGTVLAEFPIRCLTLSAQVAAGLWRRNGLPIHRQAVHYSGVPFCRVFRDLDIGALQLSSLYLGFDRLLALLLDRFSLTHWASSLDPAACTPEPFDAKTLSILAEELLLVLIHVVTELPRPAGREHKDAALRRELVHRLGHQECSHSEVQQVMSIIDDSSLGAERFDAVLKAVSIQRPAAEGVRFDLRPEAVLEYDVAFYHLGKQEHETAQERILQKRRALPRDGRTARPCVSAPPPAHASMAAVRNLLYWPQVLKFQHTVFSRALHKADVETSPVLLSRAIHILTLQLHCLSPCRATEMETRHFEPASLRSYQLTDGNPVADFLTALTRPMHGESILELVCQLARLAPESTHLGRLYEEGLRWILDEIASVHLDSLPPAIAASGLLQGFGGQDDDAMEQGGGGADDDGSSSGHGKCDRAKQAQARATALMNTMQQNFMANTNLQEEEVETQVAPDSLEFGAPACLYCHERTGSPLGYIGFTQKSTVLAEAVEKAPCHKGIATRYRVSHKECRIRAGAALDSAEVAMLRKGDQVVVEEKKGRRLRISYPVEGWVSEFTADRARILEPMSRYCWQSWGRVRLYTTMCGHAVHHDCWDAFYASMLQQMSNEDRYDGQYALDIGRREFVCPLCKTLSNVLVPHLPHHYSAPATPTPTPSPSVPHLTTWLLSDVTSGPSPAGSQSLLAAVMCPEVASMPRPGLPEPLARAVRRFTDSMLEVCEVGYSRLIVGTDSERSGRRQLLRTIYTAWSALAYSVMLDVVTDGVSNSERLGHLALLARATRELQMLILSEDDGSLADLIYRPLAALLRGECRAEMPVDSHPAASVRAAALKRFPLGLVLDHEVHGPAGQNMGQPLKCMNTLHRDRVEAGELPPLEAWPMMDKPLLSWDLTTLAAALLTTTRHGADMRRAAKVLALARLAQAMLTPLSSSAGGSSSSTSMDVDDTASSNDGFALLRAALYRGLQREAPPCPPHETLQSRWRPYLCALLTLLEALGAITLQPGDLYGEVEDLLLLLGLPAEFGRDEAGALTLVFERWGTQFRVAQEDMAWTDMHDGAKGGAAASSDGEWVVVDDKEQKPAEEVLPLPPAPKASQEAAKAAGKAELGPLVYHCAPYLAAVDGSQVMPDLEGKRMPRDLPLSSQSGLSTVLYDLSHLGVSDDVAVGLADLPRQYTELYALLKDQYWSMATRRAGSRSGPGGGHALEDPAICLICGSAMGAGPRSNPRAGAQNIGECTAHARQCGAGHGIFLMVNKGSIVLMRDSRAAFYPSVYVDQYGEEDPNLRRGRPLYLSKPRYEKLLQMYRSHGTGKEVARIRSTAERVIRENYY